MPASFKVEDAVRQRYSSAARDRVESLCCAVEYDRKYLKVIPSEVIERDYGCGDPSKYLRRGETVLDLGSGAGKICFIAAQVVGPTGRVIGIDINDDMLALARKHQNTVGERLGYHNVEFRKGRIQDLALDLEKPDAELRANRLWVADPLVASESIDVVVSNCVLNLVDPRSKRQLFAEIFRVLKNGGRAVISDIVSSQVVPEEMQNDPELWSGCISGAMTREEFSRAFLEAGFCCVQVVKFDPTPWRTVREIEFRSVTIEASKGPKTTFEPDQCCDGTSCC